MCEFQQNIIGGGGGGGGGELPEWSKVNYLESDEVGVDQKKKAERKKEETSTNKIHTNKNQEKTHQLKKKNEKTRSRRALTPFSNLKFQKQESQKYFSFF